MGLALVCPPPSFSKYVVFIYGLLEDASTHTHIARFFKHKEVQSHFGIPPEYNPFSSLVGLLCAVDCEALSDSGPQLPRQQRGLSLQEVTADLLGREVQRGEPTASTVPTQYRALGSAACGRRHRPQLGR